MANMTSIDSPRVPDFAKLLALGIFSLMLSPSLGAQAATEAAGATSLASSSVAATKPMEFPKALPAAPPQGSTHILVSPNTSNEEANRQALEATAGKDAGRLLIRTLPSQAQVWINERPVGSSPLLLVVAPGKYKIELRGTRQERAQQELAVLPRETQEVTVRLQLRYPTRVLTH